MLIRCLMKKEEAADHNDQLNQVRRSWLREVYCLFLPEVRSPEYFSTRKHLHFALLLATLHNMASFYPIEQLIDDASHQALADLLKRLIRERVWTAKSVRWRLVERSLSPAARKHKHEDPLELGYIEPCTVCHQDFKSDRLDIDYTCRYHYGMALSRSKFESEADHWSG